MTHTNFYLPTLTLTAKDFIAMARVGRRAEGSGALNGATLQADGRNVVIVTGIDDPYFDYFLSGDEDGSITLAGTGHGSVFREGTGWGDAEKTSSGQGHATNYARSPRGACSAMLAGGLWDEDNLAEAHAGFAFRLDVPQEEPNPSDEYPLQPKAQLTIQSKIHSDEKTTYGYMLTFGEAEKSVPRNWALPLGGSFEETLGMGLREALDHQVHTIKIFNAGNNEGYEIYLHVGLITNEERMGKLVRKLGESETRMERDTLIDQLVEDDMERHEDDPGYLEMLLRNGFVGYQNQTFKELKTEWDERLAVNGNDDDDVVRESE
jgi:hypothetical protein